MPVMSVARLNASFVLRQAIAKVNGKQIAGVPGTSRCGKNQSSRNATHAFNCHGDGTPGGHSAVPLHG